MVVDDQKGGQSISLCSDSACIYTTLLGFYSETIMDCPSALLAGEARVPLPALPVCAFDARRDALKSIVNWGALSKSNNELTREEVPMQ